MIDLTDLGRKIRRIRRKIRQFVVPIHLPITGPMEDSGVVKLYEPSPTQCLYVAPAENMVGMMF